MKYDPQRRFDYTLEAHSIPDSLMVRLVRFLIVVLAVLIFLAIAI